MVAVDMLLKVHARTRSSHMLREFHPYRYGFVKISPGRKRPSFQRSRFPERESFAFQGISLAARFLLPNIVFDNHESKSFNVRFFKVIQN